MGLVICPTMLCVSQSVRGLGSNFS